MSDKEKISQIQKKALCLLSQEDINAKLQMMAQKMNLELQDENPIFICVMLGGVISFGQLLPMLTFPLTIDYIHATRYTGELSGGQLKWLAKPVHSLEGRTVVVFDDILDKGVTLAEIVEFCRNQGATKVLTAVLLDKNVERSPQGIQKADYVATEIEDKFVFGYGLDYKDYLRNLPGIYHYEGDVD